MSYEGKHRDNTPKGTERGLDLDHEAKWTQLYPCKHHHPRHSAFVCKLRAA